MRAGEKNKSSATLRYRKQRRALHRCIIVLVSVVNDEEAGVHQILAGQMRHTGGCRYKQKEMERGVEIFIVLPRIDFWAVH